MSLLLRQPARLDVHRPSLPGCRSRPQDISHAGNGKASPGSAEIQVRPSRKWWFPRTGAERT
ncbi:MAG: hypothetical protein EOQ30_30910 [Mesorhizobium sp.]|nr:MAG: hypothetical protein EOQ29_16390 [Mesorhizobium sp.]RWA78118.1 MAG: hypothetical protein EOQ30_30910 [Mesorhizobium sp.]